MILLPSQIGRRISKNFLNSPIILDFRLKLGTIKSLTPFWISEARCFSCLPTVWAENWNITVQLWL